MSEREDRIPPIPLNSDREVEYGDSAMQAEATRLMLATKAGDREAFDQLVRALRGRAFAIARSLVGSREEALDLSQEAFLKTYRARATFRDGEPFLPWFHRILRNTCFSYLRRARRLRRSSLDARDEDGATAFEVVDEHAALPADVAQRGEEARLFWRAFRGLSQRDREILGLRHFEELSYQEIAEQAGVPVGTVMSRLFHARRRLREALREVLDDLPDEDQAVRRRGPRKERAGEEPT